MSRARGWDNYRKMSPRWKAKHRSARTHTYVCRPTRRVFSYSYRRSLAVRPVHDAVLKGFGTRPRYRCRTRAELHLIRVIITTTTTGHTVKISVCPRLRHRRTRASYVYNGCLAWYNVERLKYRCKFVGLPLATRATTE